jgi:hypothetical protein
MNRLLIVLAVAWAGTSLLFFWLIGFNVQTRGPNDFYAYQTEALLSGHLALSLKPDPHLASLENPYEGAQNLPYRVQDLSYYKGRYYSYFGVGPIIYLLAPWRLVTGRYVTQSAATVILGCATNFVGLLVIFRLFRRFAGIGVLSWLGAYLFVCLGTWHTIHFAVENPGTVAQEGGYFWLTAALFCMLVVMETRSLTWLALLSLACGLILSSRPNLIFCTTFIAAGLSCLQTRTWKTILAAIGPLALVSVGLLVYNYLRFDSFTEFGNRLQLVDHDYRSASLLSLTFLHLHLVPLLVAAPKFQHFFPFLVPGNQAIGLLWICPAVFLAIAALGMGILRTDGVTRRIYLSLLVCTVGSFLFLAAYRFYLFHYSVDFVVPAAWLAVVGWAAGANEIRRRNRSACLFQSAALIAAQWGIALALLATFSDTGKFPGLNRVFNRAVASIDALRGLRFGSVRLSVGPTENLLFGENYPLISSSVGGRDVCYLRILSGSEAQVGVLQEGVGPISVPFSYDSSRGHEFEISMGAFLPPANHPFYEQFGPDEAERARRLIRVSVDGRRVMLAEGGSQGSDGTKVIVGGDSFHSGFVQKGIAVPLSIEGIAFDPAFAFGSEFPQIVDRGVQFEFLLDSQRIPNSSAEPLLSVREPNGGIVVYLKGVEPGTFVLGFDRWRFGAQESRPLPLNPRLGHKLLVYFGEEPSRAVIIIVDGNIVLRAEQVPFKPDPRSYFFGYNQMGSSIVIPGFSGAITNIVGLKSLDPKYIESESLTVPACSSISFTIIFDRGMPADALPVLSLGGLGNADIIYLKSVGNGRAIIGRDHWGSSSEESHSFAFESSQSNRISIELFDLINPGRRSVKQRHGLQVSLNGRIVFFSDVPLYPVVGGRLSIGENPIGGSVVVRSLHASLTGVQCGP